MGFYVCRKGGVSEITITVTASSQYPSYQYIETNGQILTEAGEYTYPIGQEMGIVVQGASTSNYIMINGEQVAEGLGSVSYTYVVTQNINVYFGAIQQGAYRWISITFAE